MTKSQMLTYGGVAAGLIIAGLIIFFALSGEERKKAELAAKFPDWTAVEGKVDSYSAKFPKSPVYDTQEIPLEGSDLTLRQELYALNDEGGMGYVVSVMVYPFPPEDDPAQLLKTALDGMVRVVPGSKIVSSDAKSTVSGKPYLEFVLQSESLFARGRLMIEGAALYDIHAVYSEETFDPERYDYFVTSLETK